MSKTEKNNKLGYILIGISGGAALTLSVVCLPFVLPAFRRICLPFVPATTTQISNVLTALKGRSGRLIDLGSGDGRIVFSAARVGFEADGIELNPWLVIFSKLRSLKLGLKCSFFCQDLWKFSLQSYENVVIFGVQEMMQNLENKLTSELSSGSCVVACRFPLPSKLPDTIIGEGIDTVWVYKF